MKQLWPLLLLPVLLLPLFFFGTNFLPFPDKQVQSLNEEANLRQESNLRKAKEATLRVRNISCRGAGLGTAVAIDSQTLVTNRHVIEGAQQIEVTTWDGKTVSVPVRGVLLARNVDIALVRINGLLPAEAEFARSPAPGEEVLVVGYPGGRKLQIAPGKVLEYIAGSELGDIGYRGRVMVVSAAVRPGNSGGPLLDANGDVAGIVFAVDFYQKSQRLGNGYVIPFDEVVRLLRRGGQSVLQPQCRQSPR